jgi:polysaccharide export outer membrane protein
MGVAVVLSGCATPSIPLPSRQSLYGGPHSTGDFADIGYATWNAGEPPYRLYPGDVLEVSVPSAPELARTVTVQPDGRIDLPLIAPTMVADRSIVEAETSLARAYASQLLRPQVEISVKQAAPLQVFVGGEVKNPGVFTMPGDINALQAVLLAGDFLPGSRREEVIVIRRGADGQPMMRTVNLRQAIYRPGGADAVPLRRFDIVYVPKTSLQAIGDVVSEIRNALPIQFTYVFGSQQITN